MPPHNPKFIVSACLVGVPCRYDGTACAVLELKELVARGAGIALCPEELGGLSTPRWPAEICAGRVINSAGEDVTAEFQRGAKEVLALAQKQGITQAVLKERSPSCGLGLIYDGTFTRTLTPGSGVTAELLRCNGVEVMGESDFLKKGNLKARS